ncbi:nicotinate mononucleotide-dependent phosphoribosyltransferase CobT [Haladaptatus sp. YSMS36]|uniref:nicotinate mononucleotide-dependent phosphoribosyltransferase CobT n=1 Tax=Haladaptatus sp. YSMS36 TaxID=3033384 RepID=UPI0023E77470|nr:TIGR00303 family protein [Haladaptatus sp. YSMS36]
MRFLLVCAATETARIEGISAAGATRTLMAHTPAADAELLAYGQPALAPVVPVSPDGCPTPAIVTRAVREWTDFPLLVCDAGLAAPTGAPTVSLGNRPGGDIRDPEPVSNAHVVYECGVELGRSLPDDHLVVGESIPGGTTTALGVLTALGEPHSTSSSLPENPQSLKERVVEAGLRASDLEPGDCAGDPIRAVERMGDPMLAAVAGLAVGALDRGARVTLAGGTQQIAAAALVRHAGIDAPLELATTSFVAADSSADVVGAASALDLDCTVTDPGFPAGDHVAFDHYRAGVAKEGAGMGGALALAAERGVSMAAVRDRIVACYDRLVGEDGP